MANTVLGSHGSGTHGSRPAGNAVPDGSLYSCSTHSLVYVSSYGGNSWATWASLTGTGLADPMTTRGDIIVRNASNVTDRLAIGATAGMVPTRVGSDVAYALPPGYEFDYATKTSDTNCSATSEATANTVVTGNAVTYDGSTVVLIEFSAYATSPGGTNGMIFTLYDGSSSIGYLGQLKHDANTIVPVRVSVRLTPSNAAHTYSIRVWNVAAQTSTVYAGAGGISAASPAFIRITKV